MSKRKVLRHRCDYFTPRHIATPNVELTMQTPRFSATPLP